MLTKVSAFNSSGDVLEFDMTPEGRQATYNKALITNIDGLEPVQATISSTEYGSIDGAFVTGKSVGTRNIVMTLLPNPDWNEWSFSKIRRLLYDFFMPRDDVRLVFDFDDIPPAEISGSVENCAPAIFSKQNETQVSIINPKPEFVSTYMKGFNAQNGIDPAKDSVSFEYEGSVKTGFLLNVLKNSGGNPDSITITLNGETFVVNHTDLIQDDRYFQLQSIPGNRFVKNVVFGTLVETNLMSGVQDGSVWPILKRGTNVMSVHTDTGIQDWGIQYYDRYGGL